MNIKLLMNILSNNNPVPLLIKNEQYVFSLIPELKICKGFNQNNEWHIYDVYEHILKVVENVPNNLIARFVALFHDVGKPLVYYVDRNGSGHFYGHWEKSAQIFQNFSNKYKLDIDFVTSVSNLILYHDINFEKISNEDLEKIIKIFNSYELKLLFQIKRADLLAQNSKYHEMLKEYDKQEAMVLLRKSAQCD